MADSKCVAFVGAHPDDIELCAGGLASVYLRKDIKVKFIIVTDGAYQGRSGHKRTKKQAKIEQESVKNVEIINLDYKIGSLKLDNELVSKIEDAIEGCNIVITHNRQEKHHEHRVVSIATIEAARNVKNLLLWITPATNNEIIPIIPNYYVRLFQKDLDNKIDMITKHRSECKVRQDRWINQTEIEAKFRGIKIGVRYAEAYQVLRMCQK